MKFSVIMACHNRRDLTVNSILAAQRAADHAGVSASYIVFDDGSTDGTREGISDLNLPIQIIQGDGSAYWAKSMAIAEEEVLGNTNDDDDYIVWLNDDVVLDIDSFVLAGQAINANAQSVIVGATREPTTEQISYSGMVWKGPHPLSFERVTPSPLNGPKIDTFNGNFVIVSISNARQIGGIDCNYSHAFADIDYGLRCRKLNIPIVLISRSIGTCPRNAEVLGKSPSEDWKRHIGLKGGGNYHSLKIFLRKTNPRLWWIIILISYSMWWMRRLLKEVQGRRVSC